MAKKNTKLTFYINTDATDIENKSLGIHCNGMFDDRGLSISIRHNKDKKLFDLANKLQKIIVKTLNSNDE